VETALKLITRRAKEDSTLRFTSLIHYLNVDNLMQCFRKLKRNKAPGVDGVTLEDYEKNLKQNVIELVARMKAWRYRPQPVLRVYIAKPEGGERPLGIPAVEDKIVQMGITRILQAIFEVDFLPNSYGFRPKRGCHDALKALNSTLRNRPINHIVDADIKGYFDNVDHKWLMKFLGRRIADPNFLRLIGRFLRADVVEDGKRIRTPKGTPQGGILSPVLSNIYLHYVLDLWFENDVKPRLKGASFQNRYADDFVLGFQAEAASVLSILLMSVIVSTSEEPYAGKPHVRFCEGYRAYFHGLILWHSATERAEQTEKTNQAFGWSSDVYSTDGGGVEERVWCQASRVERQRKINPRFRPSPE
jgi:group II intron reverse transcriptase/maturase